MTATLFAATDRRAIAAYDLVDASRYLRLPKSTLRAWFAGQPRFERVLVPVASAPPMLSFYNLVEAYVLGAMRREHDVPLRAIRLALDALAVRFPADPHPLLSQRFSTDGVDLFIDEFGRAVNISQTERLQLHAILDAHLRRIEFEPATAPVRFPVRLYPFVATPDGVDERRTIVIDPDIAGGRRVIAGTGIRTEIVAERFFAGDGIEELAADYGRTTGEIEDAIRAEIPVAA